MTGVVGVEVGQRVIAEEVCNSRRRVARWLGDDGASLNGRTGLADWLVVRWRGDSTSTTLRVVWSWSWVWLMGLARSRGGAKQELPRGLWGPLFVRDDELGSGRL